MSDTSQGPGWWRASNGLWYPPEATPGPRQAETEPGEPRRPPGVPERPPADPKVQPPFTPRRVEPLELHREHARLRDRRRHEDEPPRRRVPWRWLGVGLLVLAFGGLGTWLALTADDGRGDAAAPDTTASTTATTAASTSTTAPTTSTTDAVSVFALAAGDCFVTTDEPDTGTGDDVVLRTVELVDCDEPHLAEVIAVTRFPDAAGAAFPGAAARDRTAQELCTPEFESYVGVALAESALGLVWLSPTEATWTEEDDREVTCAAQAVDGEPLVGSVAGSAR